MAKSCELQINNISDGLIAYPQNAKHFFMIRLLNRMLRSYGVKIYSQQHMDSFRSRNMNRIETGCLTLSRASLEDGVLKAKNKLFALAPTKLDSDIDEEFNEAQVQFVIDELVELAMNSSVSDETLPFKVLLKDGMIVVREHTLSHIIGIASSLNIPDGSYIENIISAIYIAKSLHVSIDEIRSAITDLCLQSMEMEMIAEKHGMRYFDNSNVSSHSECIDIVSCFDGDISVMIGGPKFTMTAQLEDALVRSKAHILVLPGTQDVYVKGLHERLPVVYDHMTTIPGIVHEAEALLCDGGAVLFFPSLNTDCTGEGSFEFFKEVLKS